MWPLGGVGMTKITRFNYLTLSEFISLLEDRAPYSPIIQECVSRLEASDLPSCPICSGDIEKFIKEN